LGDGKRARILFFLKKHTGDHEMKKEIKIIFDILSILIVLFSLFMIVVLLLAETDSGLEKALYMLSISVLLSVFLAGALFNLLRRK